MCIPDSLYRPLYVTAKNKYKLLLCVKVKIYQEGWEYNHRKLHRYVVKYLALSDLLDILSCHTAVNVLDLLYDCFTFLVCFSSSY
jgi:hypothetical protein